MLTQALCIIITITVISNSRIYFWRFYGAKNQLLSSDTQQVKVTKLLTKNVFKNGKFNSKSHF